MLNKRSNIFKDLAKKRMGSEDITEPNSPAKLLLEASKKKRQAYDFTGKQPENRKVSYDSNSIFATGLENEQTMFEGDVNEQFAQRQGWGLKASAGIARTLTKAGIEISKMPGVVIGLGAAPFAEEGKGWETFTNNSWIKSLNELNEQINKDYLPVYVRKAVEEGDLWTNLTSTDFWATEGADGAGYILSMFAPGAAIKGLNIGSKLTKLASMSDKVTKAQKILGLTPQVIDEFAITAANTIFEASAEAGNAIDTFQKDLNFKLENGQIDQITYDNLIKQSGSLGRDIFLTNMAILAGPNAINTKLLYGGNKKINSIVPLRDVEGKMIQQASLGLKGRSQNVLKSFASALGREGFFEEGLQSTTEEYFKDLANKGELSNNFFNDINPREFVQTYIDMLGTTEGQKAIALGGLLGGNMQVVSDFKSDSKSLKETNRLLNVGHEVNNMYLSTFVEPDIYKKSEQKDENDNYIYELDSQGKRIIDPKKRNDLIEKGYNSQILSSFQELANTLGDKETLNYLQKQAETNLILPFITNNDIGMDMLNEFLNENKNLNSQQKENIIKKANIIQNAYNEINDFGKDVLNLNTSDATEDDINSFYNKLANIYMTKSAQEQEYKESLKDIDDKFNKILELNNITNVEYLNRKTFYDFKDNRLSALNREKVKLENLLNNVIIDKNLVWDKQQQQNYFDYELERSKALQEKEKEENIQKVDKIIDDIEKSETLQDVDKALDSDYSDINFDEDSNEYSNATPEEMANELEKQFGLTTTPINIDSETKNVIEQKAQDKKIEINNNKEEINKENKNKIDTESKELIADILSKASEGEIFTINNVDYESGEFFGTYILTKVNSSEPAVTFDSKDAMMDYIKNNLLQLSEIENEIENIENEFETTNQNTFNQSEAEEILTKINDQLIDHKMFPTIKTLGVFRDGNKPAYVPESFYNWLIKIFNNKKNEKVTFSKPSNIVSSDQELAYKMFSENNISNLDFLIRNLPIQFNVSNTYSFIPTLQNNIESSHPEYVSRKNLVQAIIKNKSYEGINTTINYQKAGKLNYSKTQPILNEKGEQTGIFIEESNLLDFEEFYNDIDSIPLYFVMDELGTVRNSKNKEVSFSSTLTSSQKGYVYTEITSHNGQKVPVKLNIRKLSIEQADIIYELYKSLRQYNLNNSLKLTQKNAKLTDLYKNNSNLKNKVEQYLSKELNVFKNKNNIILGDLITLLIHDNLAMDGSRKAYTVQYKGASLNFGEDSYLNFDNEYIDYKNALMDFLTTEKRQNIKLKFLAGENINIDSKKYKQYLIENKILSTNIDPELPFTGDINIYLNSKFDIKEINKEINKENIRNSENNSLSLSPQNNKPKPKLNLGNNKPGLSLKNNPNKKC